MCIVLLNAYFATDKTFNFCDCTQISIDVNYLHDHYDEYIITENKRD